MDLTASCPDAEGERRDPVPGCVAAGGTRAEVERLIREAIQLHLEGMREDGEPIPEPTTGVDTVEV